MYINYGLHSTKLISVLIDVCRKIRYVLIGDWERSIYFGTGNGQFRFSGVDTKKEVNLSVSISNDLQFRSACQIGWLFDMETYSEDVCGPSDSIA